MSAPIPPIEARRLLDPPRKVTQSILMDDGEARHAAIAVNNGRPAGDCMRACVASILDLDPENVPHFAQYVEHPAGTDALWWWALIGFLATRGRTCTYVNAWNGDPAPKGWSIATGRSHRGHSHVCVAFDGEVVWDPHPSRQGLRTVDGWFAISGVTE